MCLYTLHALQLTPNNLQNQFSEIFFPETFASSEQTAPNLLTSINIPLSLLEDATKNGSFAGLFFTYYKNSTFFCVNESNREIATPVIGAGVNVESERSSNLRENVIVNFQLKDPVSFGIF